MGEAHEELVQAALSVCGEFALPNGGEAASVGAAIRAQSGAIFTGVCIDMPCGLGFCAEASAIAEMLKHRETRIASVVAVCKGGRILPPCGRCREMMAQANPSNLEAQVIIKGGHTMPLKDLLPERWEG